MEFDQISLIILNWIEWIRFFFLSAAAHGVAVTGYEIWLQWAQTFLKVCICSECKIVLIIAVFMVASAVLLVTYGYIVYTESCHCTCQCMTKTRKKELILWKLLCCAIYHTHMQSVWRWWTLFYKYNVLRMANEITLVQVKFYFEFCLLASF